MYFKIKQMGINRFRKNISALIVLLCALIITLIYFLDIRNDYYFHLTRKVATSDVEKIVKVQEYKPYIITLGYFNENTKNRERCNLKLSWKEGSKLHEENIKTLKIFYTKKGPCDIYVVDYKVPTKGSLVIHLAIFLISFSASIVFLRKLELKPRSL